MIVHNDIHHLPRFSNAVITIGTFDGVHTGHQQILNLMKGEAEKVNGETVIITFHPHPRKVIASDKTPIYLLNTLTEKIALLDQFGVDHLVVVPFTESFSNLSAEDYISSFLVDTFHPHTIIIGHDHHFGKNRMGNYQLLESKANKFHYQVKEIPVHVLHDISISSTKIREALLAGAIETANSYLGSDYFLTGTVVKGRQLGNTIGFPTANLQVNDENKLIPGNGVYAVKANFEIKGLNEHHLTGMMNIGIRPTVDGTNRVIEVHLFDFNEDIYGKELTVTIIKRLRDEIKFNGVTELIHQLKQDKITAELVFKK